MVGIHYISMTERFREDTKAVNAVPRIGYGDASNRSAYMWDSGLWATCRESRKEKARKEEANNIIAERRAARAAAAGGSPSLLEVVSHFNSFEILASEQ
ncbi:unnamed protein product [Clonostachys rhizophaga]|uniref:Uncharacterized protein n=1 Tax=Clonostachys rhizophaga TaxID=160324 RepID=A0A9N9VP01_9HYPO|nr:unnamed protein product [Clonostachys rhizophaga]